MRSQAWRCGVSHDTIQCRLTGTFVTGLSPQFASERWQSLGRPRSFGAFATADLQRCGGVAERVNEVTESGGICAARNAVWTIERSRGSAMVAVDNWR